MVEKYRSSDQLRIQYSFFQSGQLITSHGYDSGWVRPVDRLQYNAEQPIPVGADSVRITLSSTGDADAVFDDVFADVRFQYYIVEQVELLPIPPHVSTYPKALVMGAPTMFSLGASSTLLRRAN